MVEEASHEEANLETPPDIEDWGSVEVTKKCCGAMTCRVLAPEIFLETKDISNQKSDTNVTYVGRPIKNEEEYKQVRRAVVACPFHALRITRRPSVATSSSSGDVNADYPIATSPEKEVYLLGHFSPKCAGACTYLIRRPEGQGNVMIDAPRPDESLIHKIKELGGARYLIYTHKDHSAFFHEWANAFGEGPNGMIRVIHADDINDDPKHYFFPRTTSSEMKIAGGKTQWLDGEKGKIMIIPIPGHTLGSIAIIYEDKYLFTGDSLRWSQPDSTLIGSRFYCWEDWKQQVNSLKKLSVYKFLWVLPGHGDIHGFSSTEEANASLQRGLQWMMKQPGGYTPLMRFLIWVKIRTNVRNPFILWCNNNLIMPTGGAGTLRRKRVFSTISFLAILFFAFKLLMRLRKRRRFLFG